MPRVDTRTHGKTKVEQRKICLVTKLAKHALSCVCQHVNRVLHITELTSFESIRNSQIFTNQGGVLNDGFNTIMTVGNAEKEAGHKA